MFKRFFLSEKNMVLAILLNAIIIFLLYFPQYHENNFLIQIDHFFILLFLIEAIVKIVVLGPKQYFSDKWNIFDFLIVVVSMPSLMSFFITLPMAGASIIKVLRLFRLIRIVRFLVFIPRMSMIIAGLGRALKASVFVIIVLFFLNFILALFTVHFYGEIAPEYFGNPLSASYHIFQLFTVEGWNEIPAVITERTNSTLFAGITRFYFALVVLAGGIFGMSLANAIFVDEMTMDNNQDLETKIDALQKELTEIKEMLRQANKS